MWRSKKEADYFSAVLLLMCFSIVVLAFPVMFRIVMMIPEGIETVEIIEKAELSMAGITCPRCVYVPKGLERFENVPLLEGPTVSIPTQAYLAHLEGVCGSKNEIFAKNDCSWRLGEIKYGVDDVYSRTNPPYGRPPFTDVQLQYIQWGVERVRQLLGVLEYQYVGDERQHYMENKRRSS